MLERGALGARRIAKGLTIMTEPATGAFHALLTESRTFSPTPEATAHGVVSDPAIYDAAHADYEGFWAARAHEQLDWFKPWHTVLEWNLPFAKWFVGAEVNASYNCVDRHAHGPRANKPAIIFEGEPGDVRTITYTELLHEVTRTAAMLRHLGVQRGDKVAIYLPMIPEAIFSMQACARLGATHTVVFGGFSPESLADRINDCGASFVITADGGWRRGKAVPLKDNADVAMASTPGVKRCIVVNRVGDAHPVQMDAGRDVWWNDALAEASAAWTRRSRS